MNLEDLLAQLARQEEAQVNTLRTGVRTSELRELFGLCRHSVGRLFKSALIVRGRENIYSRAGIVELLSSWNGREVGFPFAPLMDEKQASQYLDGLGLPRSVSALQKWRTRGEGPKATRVGTVVRYSVEDLEHWVKEQIECTA